MTLPTDINLPQPEDFSSLQSQQDYLKELIYELQNMYQNIAQNVNGTFRNYAEVDSSQWIPTLQGDTSGTFTYTHQYGWVLRTGIMTEVWGDVAWSATTASDGLYAELPYKVTRSEGLTFLGPAKPSDINFTAGFETMHCIAIPNTYQLQFWLSGSTQPITQIDVPSSGRVLFYNRYIGVTDE